MDTSTIITSAALLACLILPMAYLYMAQKKRTAASIAPLRELAASRGGSLSEADAWFDNAIGLDEAALMFYAWWSHKGQPQLIETDLRTIKKCRAVKNMRKDTDRPQITTIALELEPLDGNRPLVRIVLFDAEERLDIGEELVIAERWEARLNALLAKN